MYKIAKFYFLLQAMITMLPLQAYCTQGAIEEWEECLVKGQKKLNQGMKLPSVEYQVWENNQIGSTLLKKTTDINNKANVIVVPGAFTPTCTAKHIAKFVEEYNNLDSLLVKLRIVTYVVARDTPDVMAAWAQKLGVEGDTLLSFIPDPSYRLLKQLGVLENNPRLGLIGKRSVFYVENGEVISMKSEKNNADVEETSLASVLKFWKEQQ
jgi:peroxiredoxin